MSSSPIGLGGCWSESVAPSLESWQPARTAASASTRGVASGIRTAAPDRITHPTIFNLRIGPTGIQLQPVPRLELRDGPVLAHVGHVIGVLIPDSPGLSPAALGVLEHLHGRVGVGLAAVDVGVTGADD